MYTTSWCGYCVRAKALLEARENLREATSAFVAEVHRYAYG